MRCVLDNFHIMPPCDREDPIHVAWMPSEMNRLDRLDVAMLAVFERLLDASRIDIEGTRIDVDKNRLRAKVSKDLGRCGKSKRSGDDLVAGSDAQRPERQ